LSPRPLTHDLLKAVISELGGKVIHILINAMREDTYYARIVVEVNGKQIEIDARPSDAIALAVRCSVPIFAADMVMDKLSAPPDVDVENELSQQPPTTEDGEVVDESRLSAFADFLDTLDLDDLDDEE
ncbi:MAG: bifunctional nuclease family protein, partial [Anaerolineae bacterium]|nr:bifunctional nuclease family protein [Anaerolineae bacterium]